MSRSLSQKWTKGLFNIYIYILRSIVCKQNVQIRCVKGCAGGINTSPSTQRRL